MPKSKSKTEKLPPYNTPARTVLVNHILNFPDYVEKLNEGYPLRTAKELEKIAKDYSKGITFEEINFEQARKSPTIKLKKPTFRKYIQDGLLPKSIDYRTVGQKRMAVFPSDTIAHINFIYYFYQVADKVTVDLLLKILEADKIGSITIYDAIKSVSEHDNVYAGILHYICFGDSDIEDSIKNVLVNKPDELKIVLKMLGGVEKKFKQVDTEICRLLEYLKQNQIRPSEIPEA